MNDAAGAPEAGRTVHIKSGKIITCRCGERVLSGPGPLTVAVI